VQELCVGEQESPQNPSAVLLSEAAMTALEPTEAENRAWKRDVDRRNRADLRERRKREQALERRWHCVYFLYDAKDRLLYVGISANGPARLNGHETSQPWWRKVKRAEFEHIKTRSAALGREQEAIRTLNPIWNVAGPRRA
jgi:predicted GIY-YIG superfamily endonuclease